MLQSLWTDSKNHDKPYYVKPSYRKTIDNILISCATPDYITRGPRKHEYKNYFKASELRLFLLCYYPAVLKGILPDKYYHHFLLLSYGVRICSQIKIHVNQLDLTNNSKRLLLDENSV